MLGSLVVPALPSLSLSLSVCVYGWLSLCAALQSVSSRCVCEGGREEAWESVSLSLSLFLCVWLRGMGGP